MRYPLKPVQEEAQVPRRRASGFNGMAPLLYRGDVDAAHLIPTPAQAGITWGVPVARAVRVADSGGRGSRSLGWREDVGPRVNSKGRSAREVVEAGHESWFKQVSGRVAYTCAGRVSQGTKISLDASGRVACSCSGRVRQEQRYLMSSRDTRRV